MEGLRNVLVNGKVLLYGYKEKYLPDDIEIRTYEENVLVFSQSPITLNKTQYSSVVRKYNNTKDIGWNKDLHIWDYQIFWNHIRKNVKKRINTFLGK